MPKYVNRESRIERNVLTTVIYSVIWCFLMLMVCSLIIGLLSLLIKAFSDYDLLSNLSNNKFATSYSYLKKILLFVLIGPILEELIFRLYLNLTRLTVSISISLMFYANIISHLLRYLNINESIFWTLRVGLTICLLAITYFYVKQATLDRIKFKYFNYLFYSSILCFGFFHISNFTPINYQILLASPLLVSPQLFYGLFLGYVRVNYKYGLCLGIIIHITINLLGNV